MTLDVSGCGSSREWSFGELAHIYKGLSCTTQKHYAQSKQDMPEESSREERQERVSGVGEMGKGRQEDGFTLQPPNCQCVYTKHGGLGAGGFFREKQSCFWVRGQGRVASYKSKIAKTERSHGICTLQGEAFWLAKLGSVKFSHISKRQKAQLPCNWTTKRRLC
jgi:hypothetical protein